MKIVIGNYSNPEDSRNLILNESVKDYQTKDELSPLFALITKVEGLETAPYRNGTGDWSGTDGGYLSAQLFSARTITISGVYIDRKAFCDFSGSLTDQFNHSARLYIRSRLPIRTKQYMRIFLDNGLVFFTEGYCIDLKMDLNYEGNGEYQITFYSPEPALYRATNDGTFGSEWQKYTLYKETVNGYVNPAFMEATSSGDNIGIEWATGGRSNPIEYAGDMPYAPRIIIEPKEGEHIQNPQFYSVLEKKTFGLGFPENKIARFTVADVDSNGTITRLTLSDPGAYDTDYAAKGIGTQNYEGNTGSGCVLDLSTAKNEDGTWSFSTDFNIVNGGSGYEIGQVIIPYIAGATIFTMSGGQRLVIDMYEHTVTLDGASRSYYITPGSEWFELQPLSTNNIRFSSSSSADSSMAQIMWRNAYLGI